MPDKKEIPFFLDFVLEIPKDMHIESQCQARDSVTYNSTTVVGCDDD
jgi:hypothetical protein